MSAMQYAYALWDTQTKQYRYYPNFTGKSYGKTYLQREAATMMGMPFKKQTRFEVHKFALQYVRIPTEMDLG